MLRSSLRLGLGSDTIITIRFPELGRSDTCRYVPRRSSRTDALHYDSIWLWSRCFSRSWSRVITIWATTGPRRVYICSRTDHVVHCFLSFYSINTDSQPLMMAGVAADDDNVAFAVLLYSYIIAREEEDKQQTDQLQPQPQRARSAAVRQFWVRPWLREEGRNLWAWELVADRERSWKNLTTRIYSHLFASSRINSCPIVSHSCQVLSNGTRQSVTNRDRSWEIATHLNRTWCLSCPRSIPITTIWKHDEMRSLLRCNTIWYDDPDLTTDRVDRRKILNRSKSFYD